MTATLLVHAPATWAKPHGHGDAAQSRCQLSSATPHVVDRGLPRQHRVQVGVSQPTQPTAASRFLLLPRFLHTFRTAWIEGDSPTMISATPGWRSCTIFNAFAQLAQWAAGWVLAALRRPSPPSHKRSDPMLRKLGRSSGFDRDTPKHHRRVLQQTGR